MYRINIFTVLILIVIAGLMQANTFDGISLMGIKPDLLLTIVAFISLTASREHSIKTAMAAGIIKDITSSSVLGIYTVSFVLVALFLNYHQNKFYKERISTQGLIGFCSYAAMGILVLLLNLILHKVSMLHYPFLDIILKGALYTAFISPLVFFILSKILKIRLSTSL